MPNYKNAFKCKKCPESSNENGCPLWWEVILTNDIGEQKLAKGCGYRLMPEMLAITCKQATHTTYAAYDMRNKVVDNVGKVITAIKDQLKIELPEDLDLEIIEPLQIEDSKTSEGSDMSSKTIEGDQNGVS